MNTNPLQIIRQLLVDKKANDALIHISDLDDTTRDTPQALILQARAYIQLEQYESARDLLMRIQQRSKKGTVPPSVYSLLFQIEAILGHEREALAVIRNAIENGGAFQNFPGLQGMFMYWPQEDCNSLISEMVAAWPDTLRADKSKKRWKLLIGAEPQVVSYREALNLALSGDVDEAIAAIAPLLEKPDNSSEGIKHSLIPSYFAAIPTPEQRQRELLKDDGSEMVVSPKGTSGTTVILFTGLADRFMADVDVLDALFAKLGYTTIVLRDFGRNLYLDGIGSLATSKDETVAMLLAKLKALDTQKLLCLGSSGGSVGALRYGIELGAEQITCFSATTNVLAEFFAKNNDPRAKVFIKRMNSSFPQRELDTKPWLTQSERKPRVHLWFGENSVFDKLHAEHLQPLDNVTLHPISGVVEHNCILPLILSGEMESAVNVR